MPLTEQEILQMQQDLAEAKRQATAEKERADKLQVNMDKQNAYITKLEAGQKGSPTERFVAEQFRESTINKAVAKLLEGGVQPREITLMRPELDAFLGTNMKVENTSIEFVISAFDMLYGKARRNKAHAINQPENPNPNPNPNPAQPQGGNPPPPQVPPVLNNQGGGNPPPPPAPNEVKNTKDAFKILGDKMRGVVAK